MNFKCACHNSGTNSFTGKCSNCGMTKQSQGTIITLNSTLMEQYKTIKQVEQEINPPKEKCKEKCKCKPKLDKEEVRKIIYQISTDDSYSINFENVDKVINKIVSLKATTLTKQSVYNQIKLLVNTQPNDMLLGEAVRKLFS